MIQFWLDYQGPHGLHSSHSPCCIIHMVRIQYTNHGWIRTLNLTWMQILTQKSYESDSPLIPLGKVTQI